jgi:hypothetical protein
LSTVVKRSVTLFTVVDGAVRSATRAGAGVDGGGGGGGGVVGASRVLAMLDNGPTIPAPDALVHLALS